MKHIFKRIKQERKRQNKKWGEYAAVHPFAKIVVLTEEVGEVARAAHDAVYGNGNWSAYKEELIQVAATAVQMIEHIDEHSVKELYDVQMKPID